MGVEKRKRQTLDPVGYSAGANGYYLESAADGLTAHAGGGQTNAYQISTQTSRFTTVATAGDSAVLPASAAGLELIVINHGVKPMQIYGLGTDTIDDVATATGVSQMPGSVCIYTCTTLGKWYTEGLGTGYAASLQTIAFADALTAHAGGGQGSALALTSSLNRVATVATAGDSIALPASSAGLIITVINAGANPMQVFGAGTDTINGVATATGVSQMQNSVVVYSCTVAGTWLASGIGGGFSGSYETQSAVNGLTAHAGGGQGSAVLLTAMINRVTTVGSAADSVILPASAVGMILTVSNAAATNSMNVFPASGENINALSTNTAFAVAAGKTAQFTCALAGQWHSILSA